jgi:hypothetical protein
MMINRRAERIINTTGISLTQANAVIETVDNMRAMGIPAHDSDMLTLINALKASPHPAPRNENTTSTSGQGGGEGGQ